MPGRLFPRPCYGQAMQPEARTNCKPAAALFKKERGLQAVGVRRIWVTLLACGHTDIRGLSPALLAGERAWLRHRRPHKTCVRAIPADNHGMSSIKKTVAIIGASSNREKFGNKAVRAFHQQGYTVYPVNPKETSIEGLPTFASIRDVPVRPELISIYLPPPVLLHYSSRHRRQRLRRTLAQPRHRIRRSPSGSRTPRPQRHSSVQHCRAGSDSGTVLSASMAF